MSYREEWYYCDVTEVTEEAPDFSRVPADRRKLIRERWEQSHAKTTRWKMWGPQIETFRRFGDEIVVIGFVSP